MNRVIHFEIGADNPDRAVKFYEDVFDWQIQKWEGSVDYWLATTGEENTPGINGAVKHRADPAQAIINTIEVESIDAAVEDVKGAGGEMLTQKMEIPGIGFHAYCKDTEGNIFGIIENMPVS